MKTLKYIIPFYALICCADAAVTYSGIQNILIPTTFYTSVYVDIDGGGTVSEEGFGWDLTLVFNGEGIASSPAFRAVTATPLLDASVLNLTYGTIVDSSSTFAATHPGGFSSSVSHVGNGVGQFASSSTGYIGFKFTDNANAGPFYGWMRVELSNTAATGMVKDWAYENVANTSITVGAIPEPSSILLLTLCATGAVCRRRRE